MAATARYPQQLQRPGAAQLAPPTGFRIVSESESLGGGGGGSVTSGSPYQAGAGLPAAPATPTAPAAAAYAPAPVTPKHAPAPAPAPTGPVAAPAPTYALAPAAAAAPAGFSVLSESEPVIEVHDVHDSDYDIEMFFQAHPELACALLEPYEVKALSIAAQQSAYETEGVSIMDTKNFNKTITLFAQFGFSVGIGLSGWLDTTSGQFLVQSFISVSAIIKKWEIKGPKLEGTANAHVGPIPIAIPKLGTIDIWVKVEGDNLTFTIKIVVLGKTITKTFTIPL